ncbi:MAG: hypothetical protein HRT51_00495 [Colwellia sp.]|nr:hypothetical protein [Colwellia sp.]
MREKGIQKTQYSSSRLRAILNQLAFAHESEHSSTVSFNQHNGKALLKEITNKKVSKEDNLAINKTIKLNK